MTRSEVAILALTLAVGILMFLCATVVRRWSGLCVVILGVWAVGLVGWAWWRNRPGA